MSNELSEWDKRRLDLAELVATWSKDPSAQVGAVVADRYGRVIALGYNGFAGGLEDSDDLLHNDDEKLERTVHAELNAILISSRASEDGTLYVVGKPVCARCAGVVIQSKIKRVVAPCPEDPTSKWTATGLRAVEMFQQAGITFDWSGRSPRPSGGTSS
jgi:dCMP deaminase